MLLVLAAGCAQTRYAYHPTAATAREDAPATVDGHDAAAYRVTGGSVDVATLGIVDMRPQPMLHVRLTVHNGDGNVWSVDAADQEALVGDAVYERPRFARSERTDVAGVVVQPGETRTLDLYYALPPRFVRREPPPLRVDWRVRTPSEVARQQSTFEARVVPRPTVVVPPPDPRHLHRELDGARGHSKLTTMASGNTVAE